jgi:hypothetical protein
MVDRLRISLGAARAERQVERTLIVVGLVVVVGFALG